MPRSELAKSKTSRVSGTLFVPSLGLGKLDVGMFDLPESQALGCKDLLKV